MRMVDGERLYVLGRSVTTALTPTAVIGEELARTARSSWWSLKLLPRLVTRFTTWSSANRLVVIELKAGKGKDSALRQLLGYMGCLSASAPSVRGIL